MLNPFVIKKNIVLLLFPMSICCIFFIVTKFYGFWVGLGAIGGAVLIFYLLGILMLKNPMTDLVEGKGLLVLDWNSSGIFHPFIVRLDPPFIRGKFKGKEFTDVWDRDVTAYIAEPKHAEKMVEIKDGILKIELNYEAYNKAKHLFMTFPCIIYNSVIGAVVTKDAISGFEKDSMAHHFLIYTNKLLEGLNQNIRDFARYVVETIARPPKSSMFSGNKLVTVIVIIVVVIMLAIIGFIAFPSIKGFISSGGVEQIKSAVPTLSPR